MSQLHLPNSREYDLIQINDDAKDPHGLHVELVCFDPNDYGDAGFVTIRDRSGGIFLGQIEGPQLNLNRDNLGKYQNAAFNQFEELRHARIDPDVFLRPLSLLKVRLVKDMTSGAPMGIRRRPLAGSDARMASDSEVTAALNVPRHDPARVLGQISGTALDLCLDEHVLINHIGVAGSTGAGKSNVIGNIIKIAQALGFYVIVYDHKPDYFRSDERNDEGDGVGPNGIKRRDPYGIKLADVSYWRLSNQGRGQDIVLPASVLDPGVLAYTLLYKHNEELQAEEAERLLETYIRDIHYGDTNSVFGIMDFFEWYDKDYNKIVQALTLHKNTAEALRRKMGHRNRRPSWIAPHANSSQLGIADMFDLTKLAKPGHVTVIDVRAASGGQVGRSYALFLSYALRQVGELGQRSFPILHVIDEAQDIFDAGRGFKAAAGGMMNDFIRKGRSQKIGFVIGVQSASSVPVPIRNNLNSEIVMRHRRPEQVSEASAILSKDQALQTGTFGPGECFVSLVGASSVVRCQARRSPFRLPREDD